MSLISGFEKIVRTGEPLAPLTWFHLGGPAEYFAEPNNPDELAALVRRCRDENVPMRILGGGSNVLISDQGVAGVVLRLTSQAFNEIVISDDSLSAGGGAKLSQIISHSVREGLAGLEPLVGIPGTLGGALHGNAGGHGGDIGQWAAH